MLRNRESLDAFEEVSALSRRMRRLVKEVLAENALAKKTIRKLRKKNAKLSAELEQSKAAAPIDSDMQMCKACKQVVHRGTRCIAHTGIFFDVEGDEQRELDSDSETFGMWSCCDAEERDAIGCCKTRHRF
uniref:Uncharacterized protein n=1 Tax=Spongospora subterranea TaxID=70186 RepID=A0A0H5QTN7_9EUKA|eukprot:CRZ04926.1 hypothetical protein [Spongospora subterranea]